MSTAIVLNGQCFIKLKPEPAKKKKTIINTVCSEAGVFSKIKCTPHKDVIYLEIENKSDGTPNAWSKIKEVMRLVLVLCYVEDIYGITIAPLFQNSIQGNCIANVQEGINSKDWYTKHSLSDDGQDKSLVTSAFKSTNPELEKVFDSLYVNACTTARSSSTDETKSKSLINPQTKDQEDINPEDSASNIPSQKLKAPLGFGNGILKLGKFELDKRRPNQWSSDAIKALHQEDCLVDNITKPTDPNEPLVTGQQLKMICYFLIARVNEADADYAIWEDLIYLTKHSMIQVCKESKDATYIEGVIWWLLSNVLSRESNCI